MRIPSDITDLISFLEKQGLTLFRKEGPDPRSFGNMHMEYGNGSVRVRIVLDRSCWLIDMADVAQPGEWYSVDILRNLVLGVGRDKLSLAEKVDIIRAIWQDVANAFLPPRSEDTHARLKELEHERAKRIFSIWPDAALELESFLSKQGLTCQRREAPEDGFGRRLMQYADAVIGVRITCGSALSLEDWRVAVADSTRPSKWYDIRRRTWYHISLIRCIIERTDDRNMSFDDLFHFVQKKWGDIRCLFCDRCREATHARLKQLMLEETGP